MDPERKNLSWITHGGLHTIISILMRERKGSFDRNTQRRRQCEDGSESNVATRQEMSRQASSHHNLEEARSKYFQ